MLSNRNLKIRRLTIVNLKCTCTWSFVFLFCLTLHGKQHRPELWVLKFSVHDHGFKHGTFAHNELDHAMNQDQQGPVKRSKTNSQPFHGQEPPIISVSIEFLPENPN